MTLRRRLLVAFGAVAAAAPLLSFAQQPSARIPRIGFLSSTSAEGSATEQEALRAGLRELGYAEGRNLVIEIRWAKGSYDRLPELALELVRLKVDVIVTEGTAATQSAMKATTTIPIVMVSVGDPLRSGLVASLARPGGNITGLTILGAELAGKRLQLLKDALPSVSRVAFLWNPANASHVPYLREIQAAASELKLTLQSVEARVPRDIERLRRDDAETPRRAHHDGRPRAPAPPGVDRRLCREEASASNVPTAGVCGSRRSHVLRREPPRPVPARSLVRR